MLQLRHYLQTWTILFLLVSGILCTRADYAPDGIASIWFNRSEPTSDNPSVQTLHENWQTLLNEDQPAVAGLRRTLPLLLPPDPVLVIANPGCRRIQVDLGTRSLYRFGAAREGIVAPRAANAVHWIPLPPDSAGQVLTLQLEGTHAFSPASGSPMTLIASSSVLMHDLLLSAAPHFALALLFIFVGLHAAMSWLIRRRSGTDTSLWFSILTLTLGMARLISAAMEFLPPAAAAGVYYVGLLFMLLFPAGLWRFMEESLGRGHWSLIRRCWQVQLLAAAGLWISDLCGWLPFSTPAQSLGNILIALQLCVGLVEGIHFARDSHPYRRWTARGILLFSIAGLVDIAVSLITGNPGFELYPLGLLALILILVWNQERAAGEAQNTLRRQKKELQKHREELEERVRERTVRLEEASLAAETASRAKSDFLANMSHEVRTPLNAILGHAQILSRSQNIVPSSASERGQVIQQSAEHLLALINDILDLSRIEAGRFALEPCDTDLHALLESVMNMLRPRAEEKGLFFELHIDTPLPPRIETDPRRFRQVLINLLGNAIKFTDRGSVSLRITASDRDLVFDVVDTGPGLSSEDVEQLFEPFERPARDHRREGTGLGLAISRQLAHALNGHITVRENLEGGTIFTFSCPYCPAKGRSNISSEAGTTYTPARPNAPPAPSPLPAEYSSLQQSARIGDVASALKALPVLRESYPEHNEFLNEIQRLAQTFQITALQKALNPDP